MTATIFTSECVAYDTITTYTNVTLTAESTGTITKYEIGTADSNTDSITWEDITLSTTLTLATPNKALFLRITGNTGAILSEVRLVYS